MIINDETWTWRGGGGGGRLRLCVIYSYVHNMCSMTIIIIMLYYSKPARFNNPPRETPCFYFETVWPLWQTTALPYVAATVLLNVSRPRPSHYYYFAYGIGVIAGNMYMLYYEKRTIFFVPSFTMFLNISQVFQYFWNERFFFDHGTRIPRRIRFKTHSDFGRHIHDPAGNNNVQVSSNIYVEVDNIYVE